MYSELLTEKKKLDYVEKITVALCEMSSLWPSKDFESNPLLF